MLGKIMYLYCKAPMPWAPNKLQKCTEVSKGNPQPTLQSWAFGSNSADLPSLRHLGPFNRCDFYGIMKYKIIKKISN